MQLPTLEATLKRNGKATDGTLGRPHGDGTAGGVAIPLVTVALICLLATSGIWFFSGADNGSRRRSAGMDASAPPAPAPPGQPSLADVPGPEGHISTTGAPGTSSATRSGSPSASPTAAATHSPDAVPTSSVTQAPPGQPASPTPPARPVSVSPEGGRATLSVLGTSSAGTVTVRNGSAVAVSSWGLRIDVADGSSFAVWYSDDPIDTTAHGRVATAASVRALAPGESVEIYFRIVGSRSGATCSLSGLACSFGT